MHPCHLIASCLSPDCQEGCSCEPSNRMKINFYSLIGLIPSYSYRNFYLFNILLQYAVRIFTTDVGVVCIFILYPYCHLRDGGSANFPFSHSSTNLKYVRGMQESDRVDSSRHSWHWLILHCLTSQREHAVAVLSSIDPGGITAALYFSPSGVVNTICISLSSCLFSIPFSLYRHSFVRSTRCFSARILRAQLRKPITYFS